MSDSISIAMSQARRGRKRKLVTMMEDIISTGPAKQVEESCKVMVMRTVSTPLQRPSMSLTTAESEKKFRYIL